MSEDEKDRFGEKLKLLERAREDVYFAERDRQLLERIKGQLEKVEKTGPEFHCPKCSGLLEPHSLQGFLLDRCRSCGGIWMDKGELEGILASLTRSSLRGWVEKLLGRSEKRSV
ncbi:MAG TPA: zf-TFIIB domain-containing protein [Candidatus Eisenbacteria bacterium]|nr:zf-TFIIB domain-containing protein [Candidatus Eisenbacteria bacterium]